MIKSKFKKLIMSITIGTLVMILAGCGNSLKDKIQTGITHLNKGQYEEAKKEFETVLKKDPNNVEAKNLEDIINKFNNAQAEYKNNNFQKVKEELEKIPNEYSKYDIKEKIDELKKNTNSKLEEINKLNSKLEDMSKLIKSDKLNEVKQEIDKLKIKNTTKEQLKKLGLIKNELKIKIEKKEAEDKLRKEAEDKLKMEKAKQLKKLNEKKTNNIHYVNRELGIQMDLPADWRGKYKVHEYKSGIGFSYVNKKNKNVKGTLFIINKLSNENKGGFLDDTVIKNINGVRYELGMPTDVGTNAFDLGEMEIYKEYKDLKKEKRLIYETIRAYKE